ncbi:hypothetical protein SBA3_1650021 [Candidatus Sulfopaludibacter sp. SbA3]|nr:hypothetical protein SBA3_1650021 [Candidatus Sulfopaludibacter sp. SbA3]
MSSQRLEQLEKDLRRAAACRQYQEVASLAAEIGAAADGYAQAISHGDQDAAQAARKLYDLLSWALVMMQAARSGCAAELRRVTTASRYSRPADESARTAVLDLDV